MKQAFLLHAASQEHPVSSTDLPFGVGLGEDGTLLTGKISPGVAMLWLGQSEGAIFVQPQGDETVVRLNNVPLSGSSWLRPGDELKFGAFSIFVEGELDALRIKIEEAVRPPRLVPPSEARPERPSGESNTTESVEADSIAGVSESITAADFGDEPERALATAASQFEQAEESSRETAQQEGTSEVEWNSVLPTPFLPGRRGRVWRRLVPFAVVILSVAATAFALFVRPVDLAVTPGPDTQDITGLLPMVPYGGRFIAMPGIYTLRAEKVGYRPLAEGFEVKLDAENSYEFQMRKLPGRLSIHTSPVNAAQVTANGELLGPAPVEGKEVEAGPIGIVVSSPRYLSLERVVQMRGMGEEQLVEFELQPAWGRVSLKSAPSGAAVFLNGERAGETPLELDPLQGTHRFELTLPDYQTISSTVEVRPGKETQLPLFEFQKLAAKLAIASTPDAATILVNGASFGKTPRTISLTADEDHEVVVTKPGFQRQSRTVRMEGGQREELNLKLNPEYGVVFIVAHPADATLYVNDKKIGPASRRLRLPAVPQRLRVSKLGYVPETHSVTPDPRTTKKLEIKLARKDENKKAPVEAKKPPVSRTATSTRKPVVDMVRVNFERPARFKLGASRREQGRRSNEVLYTVKLTRSFMIGKTEVTNADYARFDSNHSSGKAFEFDLNGPRQPVANVSWNDAARYANWLSDLESLPHVYEDLNGAMTAVIPIPAGYRLPTEAEWAFVARYRDAKDSLYERPRKYAWGTSWPPRGRAGNFADKSIVQQLTATVPNYSDGFVVSAPVASFSANASGIFDLEGNVSEWCHDYFDVYTGRVDTALEDPTGPRNGVSHVVRGASWHHGSIVELRLSYRDQGARGRVDLGFRVARYVD